MKISYSIVLALGLYLGFASQSFAQSFTLPTLNSSQTDSVFRTMAADLAFRPVQPASDLGLWGLSLGVSADVTSGAAISSIAGSGTSSIYGADLSGTLQLPFGIAVEMGLLPGLSLSNSTMNQFGGDLKWTLTRDFLDFLPFDVALRGMYTSASMSYSQALNGGTANVSYSSTMSGGMLSVGKSLPLLNPYLGYGFVSHNSNLSSNNAGLFGSGFAGGTTTTNGSGTSGWLQLGLQLKLGFFTIAAEYDNLFSLDSYSARFAFTF